ncbi:Dak phosphatase [Thermoanaerobacter pseudethanolicus ATCC 33223]|uniref:Dak phosphatase n=1 Tax=Thermoanaerobacter pseudethanolicus (strain ATCC 33223 / 39E) TaxID=340099 RepID=B0K9Z7_THEP3|nr:Dak phosphatase [Thermoanaerobacter pseudethanolicus ATCC 33223]
MIIEEEVVLKYLDGKTLKNMMIASSNYLFNNKGEVDRLNVFPVPDGDTGSNMAYTMQYAAKELEKSQDTIREVLDAISKGTLMGAKGNSGVILSQIFRGFSKRLRDTKKITPCDFAEGLKAGVEVAYKAVMRPVEGTILTVCRETAEEAEKICKQIENFEEFFTKIIEAAEKSLQNTPNLLPVLKEAGVVDSGGMGFVYVLKGMFEGVKGNKIEPIEVLEEIVTNQQVVEDLRFLYCTEILVKTKKSYAEAILKEKFGRFGDSLVLVSEEDILKVHVHTNNPGLVLEEGLKIGELIKVKIDNMKIQHESLVSEERKPEKKYGVLVVANGQGVKNLFSELGCDVIINGGQTMNPSTNDILEGIKKINAENILVFPNNKNIIMACEQAKALSNKKVEIIPTNNFNEAITAIVNIDTEKSLEENVARIKEILSNIKTIEVTYSIRDTQINGFEIKKGDVLGFINDSLESVGKDYNKVAQELIYKALDEDSSLVSIYYGEQVTKEKAEELKNSLSVDADVEIYFGGQPLYYYVISIE